MGFILAFYKNLFTGTCLRKSAAFFCIAAATAIAQHNGPVSPSCGPNQQDGDVNTNTCRDQTAPPAAPVTTAPQSAPAVAPADNRSVSPSASQTPAAQPAKADTQGHSDAAQRPDVTIRSTV